jgi:hypothetical protein
MASVESTATVKSTTVKSMATATATATSECIPWRCQQHQHSSHYQDHRKDFN